MVNSLNIIDDQTTIKQNYASTDIQEDAQNLVFKNKLKLWQKLTRVSIDGTEAAIIIPYDTYVEPFYDTTDIDLTETDGVFDSANHYYRLYIDPNGNYKFLQSKYICWINNRTIKTIQMTVYAEDINGNETNNFDSYIYNGNEWIATKNGISLSMYDYIGSDLDADLDADLGGQYSNKDENDNIIFQNKLKYKIIRTGTDEVRIKKVIIKVTWNEAWTSDIYGSD